MPLSICFDAAFDNMWNWKIIREKAGEVNNRKASIAIGIRFPVGETGSLMQRVLIDSGVHPCNGYQELFCRG
jgi:hypothetical protein